MDLFSRICLGIQYDGSQWQGWQTQPNGLSIQDQVEKSIHQFTGIHIKTTCAGRTDSGVHATQQIIHCDTHGIQRETFSWVRGLNNFLPYSIKVIWVKNVSNKFHARFDAISRQYTYIVYQSATPLPLLKNRANWIFYPVDVTRVRYAIPYLIGEHDFSCFRSSQCQARSPIRRIYKLSVEQRNHFLYFKFEANSFLHHMVRNLVSALITVGRGKKDVSWLDTLMKSKNRSLAPPTFCPEGLYFLGTTYPDDLLIPAPKSIDFLDIK